MNAALMAEAADFQIMMRKPGLIIPVRIVTPLVTDFPLSFAIDQGQAAARKGRVDFRARQYLNRRNVQIETAEYIETLLICRCRHQEIRNKDHLAGPPQT